MLAQTAFGNRQFVNLTIVLSRLLLVQVFAPAFCVEVACNAEGIRTVRLREARDDALVLRLVTVALLFHSRLQSG